VGIGEIFLILAIALILFGPEDLPDIARTIGKIVFEVRKATRELTQEFSVNKVFEQSTSSPSHEQEPHAPLNEAEAPSTDEVLLKYDDESPEDPLGELPSDMVSYEEKGASR